MTELTGRLAREHLTMEKMVAIFCADHHGSGASGPCEECRAFLRYSRRRLEKCPYGSRKPTCTNCPIHCYKPEPREQARTIMRYAGPRMLKAHPLLAIAHVADGFRRVEHPQKARRARRRGRQETE